MAASNTTVRDIGRDFCNWGEPEEYPFPPGWKVREYFMKPHEGLSPAEIRAALEREFPYNGRTARLADLARGKRNAVILIDDVTRPTPAYEIVPHVLDILKGSGIPDGKIGFLFAFGVHRPLTVQEMAAKLGTALVQRYPAENHNAFEGDFADLGTTSYGTRARVNRKVVEADLVVTVNTLAKHRFVYATGGSKIILPGVSHVDTILENHKDMGKVTRQEGQRFGKVRLDMNEVARKVANATSLVLIDATVNRDRRTTQLFVGDCVDVFRENVDAALARYGVEFRTAEYGAAGKADIGFFRLGFHSIDPLQMSRAIDQCEKVCGVPVIIADCRDRYYYDGKVDGPYDRYIASLKGKDAETNPPIGNSLRHEGYGNIIVHSPHLDATSAHLKLPKMYVSNDWGVLMRDLERSLGPDRTAAFFHDASLQTLTVI